MSLLQWLTVGKSFRDTQERLGRYKMTSLNLVPNFGSHADKFAPSTEPDSGSRAVTTAPDPDHGHAANFQSTLPDFASKTATKAGNPPMKPMMMTEPASARLEPAVPVTKQAYPRGRWSRAFNVRHETPVDLPAKESVQGELSIEHVHPVRNSLDDSDLEFKLTSPKIRGASKSIRSANPFNTEPREGFWTRLKSKLTGSSKS
jgi:hypothetical protein